MATTTRTAKTTAAKKTTAPVRRTAKKTFTDAQIEALSLSELRALARELDLPETTKKTGILAALKDGGHIVIGKKTAAPAPAKKTTAPRASASAKKEEPQTPELDKDLAQVRDDIVAAIKDGYFDAFLPELTDAIDARIDAFEAEQKKTAAKRAPAAKTTTAKGDARSKMPAVKRNAPAPVAESASEESEEPQLVRNRNYVITRNRKLNGATVKFLKMNDKGQAVVKLVKDDQERREIGSVFACPVAMLSA